MKKSNVVDMDILSVRERNRLVKRANKTIKKINRAMKKKLQGWEFDGTDKEGNIVFKKSIWVLDLKKSGK